VKAASGLRLTVDLDLDGGGPEDGVALGLTAVSSLILEVQVPQVKQGQSILVCPPEDDPVQVCLPGKGGRVDTSGGSTCQDQT